MKCMREYKAKIAEEKVKVSLYNEEDELIGAVTIDPTDFNILKRVDEAQKKISEYVGQAESAADGAEVSVLENLESIDACIRENINYVFGTDVCSVVFGKRHALSVSGGKYLFERLLEAFTPVFKDIAEQEGKASKARVAKYTGKYKK